MFLWVTRKSLAVHIMFRWRNKICETSIWWGHQNYLTMSKFATIKKVINLASSTSHLHGIFDHAVLLVRQPSWFQWLYIMIFLLESLFLLSHPQTIIMSNYVSRNCEMPIWWPLQSLSLRICCILLKYMLLPTNKLYGTSILIPVMSKSTNRRRKCMKR